VEGLVNEFRHIVDDNAGLTASGSEARAEAADKKRDDHSEAGGSDGLDERHASEIVHDLRDILSLVTNTSRIAL
jgi:hypothetical protein